jgi:hypothetical protein
VRHSSSREGGSNPRPTHYECVALPLSYPGIQAFTIAAVCAKDSRFVTAVCAVMQVLYLSCGAEGNRTPDLYIANVALYQLSYSPDIKSVLEPREYACSACALEHTLHSMRDKAGCGAAW